MSTSTSTKVKSQVKSRFRKLRLNGANAIMLSARKGVKPKIFYEFAKVIKIPEKDLATLINLSARTISNYEAQQKVFGPVYSEHLLKLISLFEKGEDVFGTVDEFNYWIRKPFWNSKETPLDWMVTPGGVDFVSEELDKLAQGYPV